MNPIKRYYSLILAVMLLPLQMLAAPADALKEAAAKYKDSNYEAAVKIYDSIMQTDGVSSALLFNVGNAYVKLDNLGAAMVYYEKAHRLSPASHSIRHNILYLEQKIMDRNKAVAQDKNKSVEPAPPTMRERALKLVSYRTSPDTWCYFAIASLIAMLACLSAYFFTTTIAWRKAGFFGAFAFLILVVVFNVFAYMSKYYWNNRGECVIMPRQVHLYKQPDLNSEKMESPLVGGTVMKIVPNDTIKKGWINVSLNEAYHGYLPCEYISAI